MLSPIVKEMLSNSLGIDWVTLAQKLGVEEEKIESQMKMYQEKSTWQVQVNELLTAAQEGKWYIVGHDPAIIDAIRQFLCNDQYHILFTRVIRELETINTHLAQCAKQAQLMSNCLGRCTPPSTNSRFECYIYLQWVKLTGRRSDWGHVIPNTEILPHQQTIYDWASNNPDKIVVLWFDSFNLTKKEIKQYYCFEKEMSESLDNLLVLDLRKVDWCSLELSYYSGNLVTRTMSVLEVLQENRFRSLGDKLDFIKVRLLYEGSCAMRSCIFNSRKRVDLLNSLPQKGVYFDLDFLPIYFDSSDMFKTPICIDDTLRTVTGLVIENNGKVTFGGHFSNSLLAVNQNHLYILGQCFRVDDDSESRLPYYWGLFETLIVFRSEVSGTRLFRMRGCLEKYHNDFLPMWYVHKYSGTWRDNEQDEINSQRNLSVFKK